MGALRNWRMATTDRLSAVIIVGAVSDGLMVDPPNKSTEGRKTDGEDPCFQEMTPCARVPISALLIRKPYLRGGNRGISFLCDWVARMLILAPGRRPIYYKNDARAFAKKLPLRYALPVIGTERIFAFSVASLPRPGRKL